MHVMDYIHVKFSQKYQKNKGTFELSIQSQMFANKLIDFAN